MTIIVSKNHKDAERLDSLEFGLESNIQEYVLDNPNAIPLYEISEDTRLFVAAREFRTTSGPIDALGFDKSGNIYVVETKLYKNPDKRTVVAQALDYGASLWKNTISEDEFIAQLNSHAQKTFGDGFAAKYADFFELDDATTNIEIIINNLNNGNIKFVVMMDKLHDSLKDLILYVNQNSKFDIYAVELEYYKHAEFEIMIPRLFGNEVKKDVASKAHPPAQPWEKASEQRFVDDIERRYARGDYGKTIRDGLMSLHDMYKKLSEKTGRQSTYSYRPEHDDVRCFGADTTSFIIDSIGRFESWKHSKNTDIIEQAVIEIENRSTNQGLFGKDWITKRSWGCTLRNFPDSETKSLVAIHEEVARGQGWS